MIARHWKGVVRSGLAGDYMSHLEGETLPSLRRLAGFKEVSILRRDVAEGSEFLIISLWDSLDAIRAFAGNDVAVAVVPPAAQALMSSYDRHVVHYEIVDRLTTSRL